MSSIRFGLDFSEDEVDQINSHRFAGREGRAREEAEESEEGEGKSFREVEHHEETTICQIENRDTDVKVGAVGRNPSFSFHRFSNNSDFKLLLNFFKDNHY